jgi:cytoskeleton protein RodZ
VFEIGSRLREARQQRALELADVERDTRIRARWLKALEEESFDLLPERVYTIGFLRTYARYLGLDEQQFVDELSSRLSFDEESEVHLLPVPARRRTGLRAWIAAAGGVAALAVIVIGVMGHGGSKRHVPPSPPPGVGQSPPPAVSTTARPSTPPARHKAKPQVAHLVLRAAYGRCWLDARLGSENGRELHVGTLELGESLRLSGARIWIRLGAPAALEAVLNGEPLSLPSVTPVNVVVTAAAVREAP